MVVTELEIILDELLLYSATFHKLPLMVKASCSRSVCVKKPMW